MEDRHLMRLIKAAERIATATERIAETLAASYALDKDMREMMDEVARVQQMAAAAAQPDLTARTSTSGHGTTNVAPVNTTSLKPDYGADVPESERWRLGT